MHHCSAVDVRQGPVHLSAAQAARAFGFPTTAAAAGPDGGAGDAPAVRTLDLDR